MPTPAPNASDVLGAAAPAGFVAAVEALADRLAASSATLGTGVTVDGLGLLAERAQSRGLPHGSEVSVGGTSHLVRAADGWFAVSLHRDDDWDCLPAWIGVGRAAGWDALHARCVTIPTATIVEQGILLGLPVAALGECRDEPTIPQQPAARPNQWRGTPPRVVDLSSMWAGPLCGRILAEAGMHVVKVESTHRPDGTRLSADGFFDRLNGMKEHVAVDLRAPDGVEQLARLIADADIVIEASRPRALRQVGIDAERIVAAARRPTVWVSITGHGRSGPGADRVAFGDDAAVAGGLVAWQGDRPRFLGDAVADPLTGMTAAAAALDALAARRSTVLDVAMARVAASFAVSLDPPRRPV